jgi:hypothetical protein
VLGDRLGLAEETYPVATWPLALQRQYMRREIVAAVGFVKPGKKGVTPQSGILMLPEEKREILFVRSVCDRTCRSRAVPIHSCDWEHGNVKYLW